MWHLQPTEVAQAVPLFHETSAGLLCVLVSKVWRGHRETGQYTRRCVREHRRGNKLATRTPICSFVEEGTTWASPETYNMTCSRRLELSSKLRKGGVSLQHLRTGSGRTGQPNRILPDSTRIERIESYWHPALFKDESRITFTRWVFNVQPPWRYLRV